MNLGLGMCGNGACSFNSDMRPNLRVEDLDLPRQIVCEDRAEVFSGPDFGRVISEVIIVLV